MKTLARFAFIASLVSCAAACGNKESAPAPQPAPVATHASLPAPKPAATVAAPVLATTDGEWDGSRVEITELKRTSGGTVTLKFQMVNDSGTPIQFVGNLFGGESRKDYYSVGGVHLNDAEGRKKYLVVRDGNGNCLCSNNAPKIAKSRVSLWAKFPAPPDSVETIEVVIPHFQPVEVPLSR